MREREWSQLDEATVQAMVDALPEVFLFLGKNRILYSPSKQRDPKRKQNMKERERKREAEGESVCVCVYVCVCVCVSVCVCWCERRVCGKKENERVTLGETNGCSCCEGF